MTIARPMVRGIARPMARPLLKGVGFSLDAFMASQADGLYYDFTKTDRHFQESTGQTLADDVGEAIGLALGQREWNGASLAAIISASAELLTPGAWIMSVAGGTSTATESPAGTLNLTGDGTNPARGDQSVATVVGRTYRLAATQSGGIATLNIGSSQGSNALLNLNLAAGQNAAYFVATATTTWIRFLRIGASLSQVSAVSLKLVPGNHAVQGTGTLKPNRESAGAKFDGTDDNLLSTYAAGAGANFIIALLSVPATLSATQYFIGAASDGTNRFRLGFNTSGQLEAAIGNNVSITASTDLRSQELVVGMCADGANVRLFHGTSHALEQAQSGSPITSLAVRIGSNNQAGTAGNFFSGAIKKLVVGRESIDLARYLQIRNSLLA